MLLASSSLYSNCYALSFDSNEYSSDAGTAMYLYINENITNPDSDIADSSLLYLSRNAYESGKTYFIVLQSDSELAVTFSATPLIYSEETGLDSSTLYDSFTIDNSAIENSNGIITIDDSAMVNPVGYSIDWGKTYIWTYLGANYDIQNSDGSVFYSATTIPKKSNLNFSGIFNSLFSVFSIKSLAIIVVAVLIGAGGLFLFWLASRKIIAAVANTLSGNHLKL